MAVRHSTVQLCTAHADPSINRDLNALAKAINTLLVPDDNRGTGVVTAPGGLESLAEDSSDSGQDTGGRVSNNDLVADPSARVIYHYSDVRDPADRYVQMGGQLCKVISGSGPTYTVQPCLANTAKTPYGEQFLALDINGVGPSAGDAIRVLRARVNRDVVAFFVGGGGGGGGGPSPATTVTNVTLTSSVVGVETLYARNDHVHRIANQGSGAAGKIFVINSSGDVTLDWPRGN